MNTHRKPPEKPFSVRAFVFAITAILVLVLGGVAANATYRITIHRGDTLSQIARQHHTTIHRLVKMNHIANPDRIYAGHRLKVPGKRHHRHHRARHHHYAIPVPGYWSRHSSSKYYWAKYAYDINIAGSGDCGNPVRATGNGRTVGVYYWNYSYGNHVVIRQNNGLAYYAHLSAIKTHVGELIHRGEIIGRVGSSGNSTGCHLHYEVR